VPQSSSPAIDGAGVLRIDVEIAQPAPRKRAQRIDAALIKRKPARAARFRGIGCEHWL
jgi:hypothetical protein